MSEDVRPRGTYQTLAEQREVLTPAEERFERARQTIGLFLGPVAFFVMYFLPLPLPPEQHTLAAILAFTIIYWLSEAIPIPATAVLRTADILTEIAHRRRIVTRATLAEEAERQAAAPATPAVSHARPPSLARSGENCGSVPSMS